MTGLWRRKWRGLDIWEYFGSRAIKDLLVAGTQVEQREKKSGRSLVLPVSPCLRHTLGNGSHSFYTCEFPSGDNTRNK